MPYFSPSGLFNCAKVLLVSFFFLYVECDIHTLFSILEVGETSEQVEEKRRPRMARVLNWNIILTAERKFRDRGMVKLIGIFFAVKCP